MSSWNTEQLVADDKRYVWHPFTVMGAWCAPGAQADRPPRRRGGSLRILWLLSLACDIAQTFLHELLDTVFYSDHRATRLFLSAMEIIAKLPERQTWERMRCPGADLADDRLP
jgi:hypothetical protein